MIRTKIQLLLFICVGLTISANATLSEEEKKSFAVQNIITNFILSNSVSSDFKVNSKHPIFKEFNVGFGGSSNFGFSSIVSGEKIWVSARDLILNTNISDDSYSANILRFNGGRFQELQGYLNKSKFFTIWITDGWQESWYNLSSIQDLMNQGYIPVFNYWYFGDKLDIFPTSTQIEEYRVDTARVATLLSELNGTKMFIIEPEFNKQTVMNTVSSQEAFADILIEAITTIRIKNPNDFLVSLCMTDQGIRSAYRTDLDCGYINCALGDKDEWEKLTNIYNYILPHLDFLSFYQIVAQFNRDYGGNPISYTKEERGVDYLPQRIANLSKYLYEAYNKPVYMPYIAVATATWDDANSNNLVEGNEVSPSGWVTEAESVYLGISEMKAELQADGLFGISTMELFDDPRHDYGGYQFLMQNEYHLGIIGSSAMDEIDIAGYGDLTFKGSILDYFFK